MEIETTESNLKNKTKYIFKEFGLNFITFFSVAFVVSCIFLLFASPDLNIFRQMILYVSTGIFAVSLINAISLLPIDIFIENKKVNLSLSFFPLMIIMLIVYYGDKKDMLTENLIKFSIALALICLVVNYIRLRRVKKKI